MLGTMSRVLNRMFGGRPGESLCARIAARFGTRCLFCRVVGWIVRDPLHCFHEINGYED